MPSKAFEWPFLKPDMKRRNKKASSQRILPVALAPISRIFSREVLNWTVIIFHSRLIYLIGDILAIFLRDGNGKVSMQVFIMRVRSETRSLATRVINFKGT